MKKQSRNSYTIKLSKIQSITKMNYDTDKKIIRKQSDINTEKGYLFKKSIGKKSRKRN